MLPRLTIEVFGVKELDRSFNRVGFYLGDWRGAWPYTTRAIQRIESEQFKSEGAHGRSGKWKPLTRKYAEAKARKYGSKPILERTGALVRSLTTTSEDTILVEQPLEYGFGTRLFYMPFVNKERPVMSLTDADRELIVKEAQKGLLKQIRSDRTVTQSIEVE